MGTEKGSGWGRPTRGFVAPIQRWVSGKQRCLKSRFSEIEQIRKNKGSQDPGKHKKGLEQDGEGRNCRK